MEQMWRVIFTLELIGLELFVRDPQAPLDLVVPQSQLKSRVIALNTLETTRIVDILPA